MVYQNSNCFRGQYLCCLQGISFRQNRKGEMSNSASTGEKKNDNTRKKEKQTIDKSL